MTAYVIADIEVTDAVGYEEYKKLAAPTVAAYGGRYVVRGGAAENLEGPWSPGRVVVLEFASVDRAREWWTSESYEAVKRLRHSSAKSKLILVEGV
jgi:uncharacterized protein (DUF1330 family)